LVYALFSRNDAFCCFFNERRRPPPPPGLSFLSFSLFGSRYSVFVFPSPPSFSFRSFRYIRSSHCTFFPPFPPTCIDRGPCEGVPSPPLIFLFPDGPVVLSIFPALFPPVIRHPPKLVFPSSLPLQARRPGHVFFSPLFPPQLPCVDAERPFLFPTRLSDPPSPPRLGKEPRKSFPVGATVTLSGSPFRAGPCCTSFHPLFFLAFCGVVFGPFSGRLYLFFFFLGAWRLPWTLLFSKVGIRRAGSCFVFFFCRGR